MFFRFVVTTVSRPLDIRVPHLQPAAPPNPRSLRPGQGGPVSTALVLEELGGGTLWKRRNRVGLGGRCFLDLEWGSGALINHNVTPTLLLHA